VPADVGAGGPRLHDDATGAHRSTAMKSTPTVDVWSRRSLLLAAGEAPRRGAGSAAAGENGECARFPADDMLTADRRGPGRITSRGADRAGSRRA